MHVKDQLKDSTEGIWLDFQKDTFVFFVEDRVYENEEVLRSIRKEMEISFVQKGILDLFLVEINDCLECSDIPFCMKEAEDSFLQALASDNPLSWQVVLVDDKGVVRAEREGAFLAENSQLLKKKLLGRVQKDYTSEDFEKAYEKNSQRYEPYDFLPFALFTQKEKQK